MNKKWIAKWSRWLHIYLSMFSFIIVLFFSVTGLTLNHADYFQKTTVKEYQGSIDSSWLNTKDTLKIKKLEISEFFRNKYAIKATLADFRIDDHEIGLAYKGSGYEASVFIDRENTHYQLTETNQGLIGFFNDLHKGRDTGKTWLWIIDISAILMTLISLTGLVLLLFLKKRRNAGLLLAIVGLIVVILFYWVF